MQFLTPMRTCFAPRLRSAAARRPVGPVSSRRATASPGRAAAAPSSASTALSRRPVENQHQKNKSITHTNFKTTSKLENQHHKSKSMTQTRNTVLGLCLFDWRRRRRRRRRLLRRRLQHVLLGRRRRPRLLGGRPQRQRFLHGGRQGRRSHVCRLRGASSLAMLIILWFLRCS